MVKLSKDQPIRVQDDQLAAVTEAPRVIPHLVSTLHAIILHMNDIYTNVNMRHFAGKTSSPPNNSTESSGSIQNNNKTTTLSAPDSSLYCQPTYNTCRVAYKDLEKILPAKPELLESDASDIDDWDSDGSESGVDEAARKLNELCQHDDSTQILATQILSTQNIATAIPIIVVDSAGSAIP